MIVCLSVSLADTMCGAAAIPDPHPLNLLGLRVKQYSIHSALEWQAGALQLSGAHCTAQHTQPRHTTFSGKIFSPLTLSSWICFIRDQPSPLLNDDEGHF